MIYCREEDAQQYRKWSFIPAPCVVVIIFVRETEWLIPEYWVDVFCVHCRNVYKYILIVRLLRGRLCSGPSRREN